MSMPGRFTPRRLLLGEQRGALGTGTMTDIDDFSTTPVAVVAFTSGR
jgi:hypothetical protein